MSADSNDGAASDSCDGRLVGVVRRSLVRWGLAVDAKLTFLNHSENITFRVDDPGRGRAILRVHRPGYHEDAAIQAELDWLTALRATDGIATHAVIPARDGSRIVVLPPVAPGAAAHRAVMFTFLDGAAPDEAELLGPFERLGEVTARLHRQARSWRRPPGFVRPAWNLAAMLGPAPLWGDWRHGLGIDAPRRAQLERLAGCLTARLERFGTTPDRFGLIHADLRLANLLLDGAVTQVIDFDDSGFGWYLYDLAAALSFIEHRADVPELVEAWRRGYARVGALDAADLAEIPTFILLRRLVLVAWCGSHAETPLAQAMGPGFTEESCVLAERYLQRFG